MDNGKKKLDVTGIMGLVFSILSFICITISSMSYVCIKIFSQPIDSSFVMIFLIIAISFAVIGIILGFDGRKRWSLGQSADGNISGSAAIVSGFVTVGCTAILILILEIQGASGILFKEDQKLPDTAGTEQQLKEKISKTTGLVNLILPHVKNYVKFMEEESAAPSIEKLSVKYGFDQKDDWGNDIIVKFDKKLDENEYFLRWDAQVSSAGPDGKAGTEDDIKPEKK